MDDNRRDYNEREREHFGRRFQPMNEQRQVPRNNGGYPTQNVPQHIPVNNQFNVPPINRNNVPNMPYGYPPVNPQQMPINTQQMPMQQPQFANGMMTSQPPFPQNGYSINPQMGQPIGKFSGQMQRPNTYDEFEGDFVNNNHHSTVIDPNKKRKGGLFGWKNKKGVPLSIDDMRGVVMTNPKTFYDVQVIIDGLRSCQSIIVDLSKINEKSSQRIMDYLSGAIYALGGSHQQIAEKLFVFTPEGVSIQGSTDLQKRFDR